MRDDLIEDITQLCESDVLRDLSDQHHATRAHGNQPKRIGILHNAKRAVWTEVSVGLKCPKDGMSCSPREGGRGDGGREKEGFLLHLNSFRGNFEL
jgi:hypothetical protein